MFLYPGTIQRDSIYMYLGLHTKSSILIYISNGLKFSHHINEIPQHKIPRNTVLWERLFHADRQTAKHYMTRLTVFSRKLGSARNKYSSYIKF